MRSLLMHVMVSVDGFAAGPDGDLDWIDVDDPDLDAYLADLLSEVDAQIFGRTSYELLADYWPTAENDPTNPGDAMLAHRVNSLPKLVVSHRDHPLPWQPATRIGADLPTEIAALKNQPGRPLVLFAGATTAQEFLRLDTIDEIRLLIFPLLLGTGQRLFTSTPPQNLRLVEAREFPKSGVVLQRYHR